MQLEFSGEVWFWRGPAPYHFVSVPDGRECRAEVDGCARDLRVGDGAGRGPDRGDPWTTSLWPKNGGYVVPLKDKVRAAEGIDVGDTVTVRLGVDV